MGISTKKGDGGRTRLLSGEEVPKDSIRTAAYGDLDEAVSAMGLARALSGDERIGELLYAIQKTCFLIGAELATSPAVASRLKERLERGDLEALERTGEELEEELKLPPVFIIPGSTPASAALDLARTVVRRVERGVVSLVENEEEGIVNRYILPYLNRLSDVLFLLARLEEKKQGVDYDRLR
jgi:cob(I)alamin adenosyltransferase